MQRSQFRPRQTADHPAGIAVEHVNLLAYPTQQHRPSTALDHRVAVPVEARDLSARGPFGYLSILGDPPVRAACRRPTPREVFALDGIAVLRVSSRFGQIRPVRHAVLADGLLIMQCRGAQPFHRRYAAVQRRTQTDQQKTEVLHRRLVVVGPDRLAEGLDLLAHRPAVGALQHQHTQHPGRERAQLAQHQLGNDVECIHRDAFIIAVVNIEPQVDEVAQHRNQSADLMHQLQHMLRAGRHVLNVIIVSSGTQHLPERQSTGFKPDLLVGAQ